MKAHIKSTILTKKCLKIQGALGPSTTTQPPLDGAKLSPMSSGSVEVLLCVFITGSVGW